MNTVESVKKNPKINRVLLVFYFAIVVFCALYAFTIYCEVSVHRGDPDHVVDNSIAKIIGHNYIDSRCLTREEVILIVSDVFVQVRQEGFKEAENANVVMGQALIMKMLEGDERGYRIKDQAKKEETLAFIGRGLGVPQYYGIEYYPPDEIDYSDWSAQPIENLIDQSCLSADEILELGDLHEVTTVSDLKFVLSRVAEAKIEKINTFRYNVLNNPFFHAIYMSGVLITGIGVVSTMTILYNIIIIISDKISAKKHKQKEEEQKQPEEEQKKVKEKQNKWRKVRIRQGEERTGRTENKRTRKRTDEKKIIKGRVKRESRTCKGAQCKILCKRNSTKLRRGAMESAQAGAESLGGQGISQRHGRRTGSPAG